MKPRIAIHWQILAALVLSTLTAMVMRMLAANGGEGFERFVDSILGACGFVGDLFMRALKMIIVPLIVTSVISGISGMQGGRGFGRLGAKTAGFFIGSSLVAILIGLFLVNLIEPGKTNGKANQVIAQAFEQSKSGADPALVSQIEHVGQRDSGDMLEVFRSMLPENVVMAATENGQMLGVIVFSILFAVALTKIPYPEMQTVHQFFKAASDAMVIMTGWIMVLAPIGVYVLILPVIFATGPELFVNLGKYFFTVLAGLLLHLLVVLPATLHVMGKVNPWAHFRAMRPALLLAFSTASSSGTLPMTMRCVEDGSGVSKRITSFTLPLGATVNMNGTALYECVAVIFVAQVMGIDLSFSTQFFIVVAALLTSIGVAGVPAASLVAILAAIMALAKACSHRSRSVVGSGSKSASLWDGPSGFAS